MVFDAHVGGVNAVSWAPAAVTGGLLSAKPMELPGAPVGGRRFVSGGSDCLVKIWDWKYVPLVYFFSLFFFLDFLGRRSGTGKF